MVGLAALLHSCTTLQYSGENLRILVAKNHRAYVPSGIGPFPTIVVVPGCSGIALESSEAEAAIPQLADDDLLFRAHYPRIAHRLSKEGFAVYLIDITGVGGFDYSLW